MNICVFDLDNTLVMTDELNNRAYNHALELFGLSTLKTQGRITREYIRQIFPALPDVMLMQIVTEKQRFFLRNLHDTKLNEPIVRLLKKAEKNPVCCGQRQNTAGQFLFCVTISFLICLLLFW